MGKMKYILVTGAYGGIGSAVAKMLSERGFCVFALDKRAGRAEKNIIPIAADITSEESISAAAETVRKYTDELFAIVHFAGIYMLDSLVEIDSEAFERIFRINLFGAFLVNKAFIPLLRYGSRIIMTTSELAPA